MRLINGEGMFDNHSFSTSSFSTKAFYFKVYKIIIEGFVVNRQKLDSLINNTPLSFEVEKSVSKLLIIKKSKVFLIKKIKDNIFL